MIISSSSSSSDAIIGGVIGGVLGLTFIVYIIYCVSKFANVKTMVKSWCILNSPWPIPVQVSDYCVCRILKTLKTNKNSFLV